VHISAKGLGGDGFGMDMGWERDMGCMREMAGALWGHTLLKTGLGAHRHTDRQTDKSENSISASFTFSAFMVLVGRRKELPACKKL